MPHNTIATRTTLAGLLLALSAAAQSITPLPASNVNTAALPSTMAGVGVEYNRYAAPSFGLLASVAIEIEKTNIYSWTTLDMPVAPAPNPAQAQPASIRTGVAMVVAQSPSGSGFFFLLGDAGLATVGGTAATGSYSGGGGVSIRIGKSNWFVTSLVRAVRAPSMESGGAQTSGFQPVGEVMAFYSFGK